MGSLTRGGASKAACSSRIRLLEPLTRKVPSTSVADVHRGDGLKRLGLRLITIPENRCKESVPFSLRNRPLETRDYMRRMNHEVNRRNSRSVLMIGRRIREESRDGETKRIRIQHRERERERTHHFAITTGIMPHT